MHKLHESATEFCKVIVNYSSSERKKIESNYKTIRKNYLFIIKKNCGYCVEKYSLVSKPITIYGF